MPANLKRQSLAPNAGQIPQLLPPPASSRILATHSSRSEQRPADRMSLDPPAYLASLQNNIRQRPIPWDGAVRAGNLTDEQLTKIRAVDKAKRDARRQIVEGDLDGYRLLFVGGPGQPSVLESAAKRQDVVQYILVLLTDLLDSTFLPRLKERRTGFLLSVLIPLCQARLSFAFRFGGVSCFLQSSVEDGHQFACTAFAISTYATDCSLN